MAKHSKKHDGSSSRSEMDGKSASKRNGNTYATSTPDPLFDVISVVYHAMQGAETCEQYLGDVSGDPELEELMTEVQGKYEEIVERSKQALVTRLEGSRMETSRKTQDSQPSEDGEEEETEVLDHRGA